MPKLSEEQLRNLAKLSGGLAILVLAALVVTNTDFSKNSLLAAVYTFASGAKIEINVSPTAIYGGTMDAAVTWSGTGIVPGSCTLTDSPHFNTGQTVNSPNDVFETGAKIPETRQDASSIIVGDNIYLLGGYNSSGNASLGEFT